MQIHTYAESYMTAFLWDCWQEDPGAGSAQPSQQMGPAEPMNRLFFPGPGFNQKEKYYSNWQVTCIVSFLKKLLQNNETTLSPLSKKDFSNTRGKHSSLRGQHAKRRALPLRLCLWHSTIYQKELPFSNVVKPLASWHAKKKENAFTTIRDERGFLPARRAQQHGHLHSGC